MRRFSLALSIIAASIFGGCSPSAPRDAHFELREFVLEEKKEAATEFSKASNSFYGRGTLITNDEDLKELNLGVLLEVRDKTEGPAAEPELAFVLVKRGVGKVTIYKSKYEEVSRRPDYEWSVVGWHELKKGSIRVGA